LGGQTVALLLRVKVKVKVEKDERDLQAVASHIGSISEASNLNGKLYSNQV
jgi:hypothetical protein